MPDTAYDQWPYADNAYYHTHPGHLAAVSLACGHNVPVGDFRVLELGCGSGYNLIAMSHSNPGSEYVGIDLSRVQIENGRALAAETGVKNVALHACSIEEFDDRGGQFHYIIAHGFYCWVPPAVRDSMFALMRRLLAPNGVAYVSYNTNPGWRLRGLMRDSLRFFARQSESPHERIERAREGLSRLSTSLLQPESMYARSFVDEWGKLKDEQDYYLLHEYLGDTCDPLYFEEFAKHASGHGLKFLAESRYWTNTHVQPSAISAELDRVGGDDLLRREQYLDWLVGRFFRQTLLCHADSAAPCGRDPDALLKLSVLPLPESPTNVGEPLRNAVLSKLAERGPFPVPAATLAEEIFPSKRIAMARLLLQGWAEGYWDVRADSPAVATSAGEYPQGCPLARLQAPTASELTNRLHRPVTVSDEERQLLLQLDGTRPATDFAGQRDILDRLVKEALLSR